MSYTNHLKIVNAALHSIIATEFDNVTIVLNEAFEPDNFKHGEYFRYNPMGSDLLGKNSGGEDRVYHYEIVYYFNEKQYRKKNVEDLLADRQERMTNILHTYNSRYVWSETHNYKWHHLQVLSTEIGNLDEDGYEHIKFIRFEVDITRFNTINISSVVIGSGSVQYYRAKLTHTYSGSHTNTITLVNTTMSTTPTFARNGENDFRLTDSTFTATNSIANTTVIGDSDVAIVAADAASGYITLTPHDFSGAYTGTPIDQTDWEVYINVIISV